MISELVLVPPDNNQCWFRRKKYGGRVSGSQRKKKKKNIARRQEAVPLHENITKTGAKKKKEFLCGTGKNRKELANLVLPIS